MAGSIMPLPIMLEEEEDRKAYEKLEAPKTIVCRFGYLREIAELPYSGDAKPGCGSKMVIRTKRGIEMAEMLTTVCNNSGCSKSISRDQMLQYIDNSGGKDYPYFNQGKVLRVATIEDLNEQSHLDESKTGKIIFGRQTIREMDLPMKLVDVEQLLGGERIIFYYTSEDWVDFRELVRVLAAEYQTRIEMHQVNARNEARLVADYEKCGQHCCCKQFLKVLKPVSMRSAKVQKATLDPTKISGRCGRLMCCLRYEDQTYTELQKRLPRKQTAVETEDGLGVVIDTQILTQLVLVRLDDNPGALQAYPLENITILKKEEVQARREQLEEKAAQQKSEAFRRPAPKPRPQRESGDKKPQATAQTPEADNANAESGEQRKPRRRRRRRKPGDAGDANTNNTPQAASDDKSGNNDQPRDQAQATGGEGEQGADGPRKKRRRRRRRKPRGGGDNAGGASGGPSGGGDSA
ncbi:MAG TPA: hypothetical protein DER01_05360 [Phycisphaerales bacterium]|nr:hypothetical protein [Phycisphaerales bacterium]|tara:strand:+ start:28913 stop:30304 length:1392 start_codon:yes stop_codon:yes gene_type:complete